MKSCNRCLHFDRIKGGFCEQKQQYISETVIATYCGTYALSEQEQKRQRNAQKAMCGKCGVLNKYGYCASKKRCITEEELTKPRKCIKFRFK